jgi:hypothetical protein
VSYVDEIMTLTDLEDFKVLINKTAENRYLKLNGGKVFKDMLLAVL